MLNNKSRLTLQYGTTLFLIIALGLKVNSIYPDQGAVYNSFKELADLDISYLPMLTEHCS